MLKVTTAKEMQHIDRTTIEKNGLAGTVLMERAGLGVVETINEIYFSPGDEHAQRTIVVLCGGGNNGGDGFVIARELHNQGKNVEIYLCVNPASLKGDAKINYDAARKFGVSIYSANKFISNYSSRVRRHCLIVDALLGTGLSKKVREPVAGIIKKVNNMSCPVISVDMPSGISSDTGQVLGCAIRARHTVTFGLPKRGHFLYPGAEYTGELYIKNIGFPSHLVESDKVKVNLVQKEDVPLFLPPRPKSSHKGTYGHALIVAGSKGKTGAALMAAKACLKTGAGLVTVGIPDTLVSAFQSRVTEEMILPLKDKGDGSLSIEAAAQVLDFAREKANVLAIGPGLSHDDEIVKLVCTLISESRIPVVVDADGINAIVNKVHILKKSRAPVVITPHPGEMARLLSKSKGFRELNTDRVRISIEQNRLETALAFARRTGTYLVLKGVPTVTASPDGSAYINSTGNPGMATAGTGDVLTGMISSFLAQRLSPEIASVLGVYIHGFAGDVAACRIGERALTASDIIKLIPNVYKSIMS